MVAEITLSLILSIVVIGFTALTAYLTFLNLQLMTEVTLFLQVHTEHNSLGLSNYLGYPHRIKAAFRDSVGIIPPPYDYGIRWFNLELGNTGPGIAVITSAEVSYITGAPDSGDMMINDKLPLGPQGRLPLFEKIPKDYSALARAGDPSYTPFTKLPNDTGSFPWKVTVEFKKKRAEFDKGAFTMTFEVDKEGRVKSKGPTKLKTTGGNSPKKQEKGLK